MARVLAYTQFLVVSIGAFVLHLLGKIDSKIVSGNAMADYAQFLGRHALWLFAVPILYAAVALALEGRGHNRAVRAAGIVLLVIVVALVGIPIAYRLY
jgi:uncharacterized membrane protein YgdD (TMEM256/DUF423 family)